MPESATEAAPDLLQLYERLYLPRAIEEHMIRLIRRGRVSKWFSGYGQEAVSVGCVLGLEEQDYVLPMHRNTGVWTTRGVPLRPLFCQLLGRTGGFTKGRDRSYHFGLPEKRIIGMISHMAAMLPVACGLALAATMRGDRFVALCFAGDGGTREGDFHEAASLAGLWNLPVLFVVENNGYGLSTPVRDAVPIEDIADAAAAYGMPGVVVDGNDVLKVTDAVRRAAERARNGDGPTLLEMKTFRMRGHEEASGTAYVPQERFAEWEVLDPLRRLSRRILDGGLATVKELAAVHERIDAGVEEDLAYALTRSEPASTLEAERADVWAISPALGQKPAGPAKAMRYIDAVSDGLRQAMEADESVVVLGQDVAEYGGVFKVTRGLVDRFGPERVRNTPIIESGAVGAAMGLALEGYKPVLEVQYADFMACGFNQIVNNLATTHYRWGAPVNVTVRAPIGGGIGAGPFHSQSNEAWFCHVPGLKVVLPASPQDAKGLLMRAVRDPNPVLFFEHKLLYRSVRGAVPDAPYETELGRARIARSGSAATIVTYGVGLVWAMEAADRLSASGSELEIIDLRTLVPWDRHTVLASIRRTHRLLVLTEAPRLGGFGAELAAQLTEEGFEWLDAPPVRVGAEHFPVPFASGLERTLYSARARLDAALADLLSY
jgi:2-oxoisovalerate dehydrogenase E1 component